MTKIPENTKDVISASLLLLYSYFEHKSKRNHQEEAPEGSTKPNFRNALKRVIP